MNDAAISLLCEGYLMADVFIALSVMNAADAYFYHRALMPGLYYFIVMASYHNRRM